MGLQFVEVVVATEERFGISLPDEELQARYDSGRLRTVADLHAMVVEKLPQSKRRWTTTDACPTSAAFYRVRRALMEVLGVPRSSIRPATPMEALVPRARREKQWSRLFSRIGAPEPPLYESDLSLAVLPVLLAWMLVVPLLMFAWFSWPGPASVAAALVAFILPLLGAAGYRHVAARHFPAAFATVGDVARYVVGKTGPPPGGGWTDEVVFEVVKAILVDQVKADPNEVTMEASLEEIGAID